MPDPSAVGATALQFLISSLATPRNLWQSIAMGNKDKGKREVKKPKKTTPKLPPARRDASPIPTHVIKKIGE